MDEQDVIVLDNGSGFIKVGFSGEDAPRAVLPTAITLVNAEAREDEPDQQAQKKSQTYYGEEAVRHLSDRADMTQPVQRGEILMDQSKEALADLWEYTFRTQLGIEQEELPILIADPLPLGQKTYPSRQWMTEIMFERLKVKSLAIFNTAVLSLFSTGRTRGLVVESGEGLTQAVPVFEGYAIPHAIFSMDVAGQDITGCVKQAMLHERDGQRYAVDDYVMRALKERVCTVAPSYNASVRAFDDADDEAKSFELPDKNIIQVSTRVRTSAPEILFGNGDPSAPSVQKICIDAIETCDSDFQMDLVRSLVVAGGTSMLPGLAPRMMTEVSSRLSADLASQVGICVDSQRRYAAWIGGSMFASLSTFDQVAITKQEYEEGRSDLRGLVARKTF